MSDIEMTPIVWTRAYQVMVYQTITGEAPANLVRAAQSGGWGADADLDSWVCSNIPAPQWEEITEQLEDDQLAYGFAETSDDA